VKFSKYQGLGNDFVIVDLRAGIGEAEAERVQDPQVVRAICDRRFGVGADGVLALLPGGDADARMRVLNADGSEAEMCGNGLRCVVKYLYDRDPAQRRAVLAIDTGAGRLSCSVTAAGDVAETVTVDMGRPRLWRQEIPMAGPAQERCHEVPLAIKDAELSITAVSMGNPHAIAFVNESGAALRALAERVGPAVEHHAWFPRRTNVEFAKVHSAEEIELVVWERGCGITLACGTGACATVVAACLSGHARTGSEVTVHLLGGALAITVTEDYSAAVMRGPATHVFDGELTSI
jgi:diaminopimelate epimerase